MIKTSALQRMFIWFLLLEFIVEGDPGTLKVDTNPELFAVGIDKTKIKIDIRNIFFFIVARSYDTY